jgi:AI-2 transport protein TqsA
VGLAAQSVRTLLNVAASALLEAGVVRLYLMFLLLEASRFTDRVRTALALERADEGLHVAGQVNAAIRGIGGISVNCRS